MTVAPLDANTTKVEKNSEDIMKASPRVKANVSLLLLGLLSVDTLQFHNSVMN